MLKVHAVQDIASPLYLCGIQQTVHHPPGNSGELVSSHEMKGIMCRIHMWGHRNSFWTNIMCRIHMWGHCTCNSFRTNIMCRIHMWGHCTCNSFRTNSLFTLQTEKGGFAPVRRRSIWEVRLHYAARALHVGVEVHD